MAQRFDIMAEMSARREMVIESYNAATEHKFFDGITLKAYMTEVLAIIRNNNPRSAASLQKLLPLAIGEVKAKHTRIDARDKVVEPIRRSGNQQALALV